MSDEGESADSVAVLSKGLHWSEGFSVPDDQFFVCASSSNKLPGWGDGHCKDIPRVPLLLVAFGDLLQTLDELDILWLLALWSRRPLRGTIGILCSGSTNRAGFYKLPFYERAILRNGVYIRRVDGDGSSRLGICAEKRV